MRQWPGLLLLVAGACLDHAPTVARQASPPRPEPRPPSRPMVLGNDWEEVVIEAPALPAVSYERDQLVRPELAARFAQLGEAERAKLVEEGSFVRVRHDRAASLGELYAELAREHTPFVVTFDALLALALRALDRALDRVDRELLAPSLTKALGLELDRLSAEAHAASPDTAEAYATARGVLAVGLALLDPRVTVATDLRARVSEDLALVQAHAGFARSAVLGRAIDYGAFDVQAGLTFGDERLPSFRALTWVARAALALAPEPPTVDLALARQHARAAMLLARGTNELWTLAADTLRFVSGPPDDPGPAELLRLARAAETDLREEANLVSVVRVDKLRTALARVAAGAVEDTGLRLPTFRLLSPSAPPDVHALASAQNVLAVGALLGSPEATTLLFADRKNTLDAALPTDPVARHASLHASALDVLATYLAPSALDVGRSWRSTEAHRKRKLGVVLAAWAALRHGDLPFTHGAAHAVEDEPVVAVEGVRAVVEPHPEAIAKLEALVGQARRGLTARAAVRAGDETDALLERVQALLGEARGIALDQVDRPSAVSLRLLATFPARIHNIERRLGGPAASPLVVTTWVDRPGGSASPIHEQGTGFLEDVWLAVDAERATSFYVGASVPFLEHTTSLRSSDAGWAKRL